MAVREGQERTVAVKKGNGAWRARKLLGADSFAGVARVLKSRDTASDQGTAPRTDKKRSASGNQKTGHSLVRTVFVGHSRGAYRGQRLAASQGSIVTACRRRCEDSISRWPSRTGLTWFLCSVRTISEMSTPVRGRAAAKSLPALSEPPAVGRVTAAVHGALVCFVLIVVAVHALGFQLGTAGGLELVVVLLLGAAGQVVWSGRAGGRG